MPVVSIACFGNISRVIDPPGIPCMHVGERQVLSNVHGLLYLPETVNDLRPFWAHSCFPFESGNGELLKLFHGSQGVEKQVYPILTTLYIHAYLYDVCLMYIWLDHSSLCCCCCFR